MKSIFKSRKKDKGFTIVELLVVLTIIAILAILAIPYFRGIIIGGRVEPTAGDINKVVAKIRSNFTGQGASPYSAIDTSVFANTARTMVSTMNITGDGAAAAITHEIGATGSTVTVAPATITTAGDSFTVTLSTVDDAGCAIGAQFGKSAEVITLNGTTVKTGGTANYQAAAAQTACTSGESNTMAITFR